MPAMQVTPRAKPLDRDLAAGERLFADEQRCILTAGTVRTPQRVEGPDEAIEVQAGAREISIESHLPVELAREDGHHRLLPA